MATTVTRQQSVFHTHTLPNGLQLIGQQIPGVQSVTVVFWVKTGTRDENIEQMGVSHFLEHMMFKRTKNMTRDEIDHAFEEMGAVNNAATWKEMTFYWAQVLGENADGAINVLSELLQPQLQDEDFQQERNVILEEIARYEDNASHVLFDNFFDAYFRDHPLAWETLGTADTIKAMSIEPMREYFARRYGTRNTLFAIAGNFDWDAVKAQLETISRDWPQGETGRKAVPYEFRPTFAVKQETRFKQEQIAIGTPSVSNRDPRYYAAAVLTTILGDDTGSRLFWALTQEGLADSAAAQVFDFDDTGILMVHVATEPDMAQRALDLAEAELRRLQSFDVSEEELERAKAKLISSVVIGGESTSERVMGLINSWLTHERLETLDEIHQKIEAVTLKDLREYLEVFPVWPKQVIVANGPLGVDQLQQTGG